MMSLSPSKLSTPPGLLSPSNQALRKAGPTLCFSGNQQPSETPKPGSVIKIIQAALLSLLTGACSITNPSPSKNQDASPENPVPNMPIKDYKTEVLNDDTVLHLGETITNIEDPTVEIDVDEAKRICDDRFRTKQYERGHWKRASNFYRVDNPFLAKGKGAILEDGIKKEYDWYSCYGELFEPSPNSNKRITKEEIFNTLQKQEVHQKLQKIQNHLQLAQKTLEEPKLQKTIQEKESQETVQELEKTLQGLQQQLKNDKNTLS